MQCLVAPVGQLLTAAVEALLEVKALTLSGQTIFIFVVYRWGAEKDQYEVLHEGR